MQKQLLLSVTLRAWVNGVYYLLDNSRWKPIHIVNPTFTKKAEHEHFRIRP
jgi:hypothetical protein